MQKIKAIIFDLGGVLLNIDYHRTEQAFIESGIPHFRELYTQYHAGRLFTDLETGKISAAAFMQVLKKESDRPLNEPQIIKAWNAMLLDFPEDRILLLQALSKKYALYLLSNTNALHLAAFTEKLQATRGLPSLDGLFRKAYYSHRMGVRKPDPAAYEMVLQENNLHPASTLFIDDTPGNVKGAEKAGLQTILLTPPQDVTDLFEEGSLAING